LVYTVALKQGGFLLDKFSNGYTSPDKHNTGNFPLASFDELLLRLKIPTWSPK
jgi:hypothetical protein